MKVILRAYSEATKLTNISLEQNKNIRGYIGRGIPVTNETEAKIMFI